MLEEKQSIWHSSRYGRLLIVAIACLIVLAIITNSTKASVSTAMEPPSIRCNPPVCVKNNKTPPIIGVLTQVLRDYKRFTTDRHLHIASSYIKWIESAGAQVLPVLLNQNESYYEQVFNQTNGLLLPGGDNLLNPKKATPMMVAAKILYRLAVEANDRGDYYPIWGTCLGLELLSVLTSSRNVLEQCSANDLALTMNFTTRGRLFAPSAYAGLTTDHDFSKSIMRALESKNLTYNYHHKCLTDEGLTRAGLINFYRPLAYSKDLTGKKFIAIFEAINYPFYGVQFHPEKPAYEFVVKKGQQMIPHSRESIAVSRYFADYFINSVLMNGHQPIRGADLEKSLIYAHDPMYTALKRDMYEQRYLFPYQDNGLSTEEFLDYLPDDNEEAPEEVPPDVAAGNQSNDDDKRSVARKIVKLGSNAGKATEYVTDCGRPDDNSKVDFLVTL